MILDRQSGSKRDQGSPETMGRGAAPAFVLLGLMIAATTMIAARAAIVRAAPMTAAAYASLGMPVNLRGLAIDGVRATIAGLAEDGGELIVIGEIVNLRQVETPAPNLRLTGCAATTRASSTSGRPGGRRSRLGPHERVAFRARLAAPPAGVRDVLVKFAAPGDKEAFTE